MYSICDIAQGNMTVKAQTKRAIERNLQFCKVVMSGELKMKCNGSLRQNVTPFFTDIDVFFADAIELQ